MAYLHAIAGKQYHGNIGYGFDGFNTRIDTIGLQMAATYQNKVNTGIVGNFGSI